MTDSPLPEMAQPDYDEPERLVPPEPDLELIDTVRDEGGFAWALFIVGVSIAVGSLLALGLAR